MRTARFLAPLAIAVAAVSFAACGDEPTDAASALFNDSTVTLDVAASAGDAIAFALGTMAGDETTAGGEAELGGGASASLAAEPNITRTRTCYDANGTVVANCIPFASVRKIVTHATITGSRSGSRSTEGGPTSTWTGSVHRESNDTTVRTFNGTTEVSRTHTDLIVGHDTTVFTEGDMTRIASESARDSVKAIKFNLPRSTNPYPVSGSVVRVDTVKVSITKGSATFSKSIVRTVEVDFPADAQGNVVLKVNAKTCNLNLVTKVVSGCHS
jgi:hypothetical protein